MPPRNHPNLRRSVTYGLLAILALVPLIIAGIITGIANSLGHSIYSALGNLWHAYSLLPIPLKVAIAVLVLACLALASVLAGRYIANRDHARKREAVSIIEQGTNKGINESLLTSIARQQLQALRDIRKRAPAAWPPDSQELTVIAGVVAKVEIELHSATRTIHGRTAHIAIADQSSALFRAPQDEVQLQIPPYLIGRAEHVDWLEQRLTGGSDTRFVSLSGLTGIGKTALVAFTVHQMHSRDARFADGIAVVHCNSVHSAADVVRLALARFDPRRRPSASTEISSLADLARRVLFDKDALILLDNIDPSGIDVTQIVSCFSGLGPKLAVVFTSTTHLPPGILPTEDQRVLPKLHNEDALELFALSYGLPSAHAFPSAKDQTAANEIVELLGAHPLAIKITAAYAATSQRVLQSLVKELQDDPLMPMMTATLYPTSNTKTIDAAIRASIDALSQDSRRLLTAFLAFHTLEVGRKAIAALGRSIGILSVRECIDELVMRSLLEALPELQMPEVADRERLRLHPLVQALLLDPFHTWEQEHEEEVTLTYRTIARHFANYVNAVPDIAFTPDLRNITAALEWAIDHHEDSLVIDICYGMRLYWHQRWLTVDSLKFLDPACRVAELRALRTRDYEDRRKAAALSLTYGRVLRRVGNLREADARFQRDLQLRRRMRDRMGEAEVLHQLGQLERCRGRLKKARKHSEQSLAIAQHLEHDRDKPAKRIAGLALAQLGRIERAEGNLGAAEMRFKAAIAKFESADDHLEIGVAFGYLARIARTRGQITLAEYYLGLSEEIAHRMQDQRAMGVAWSQRGRIARARGHMRIAQDWFERSITIGEKIQDRQGLGVNYGYLGRIARAHGQLGAAQEWFEKSRQVAREVEDRPTQAIALVYLSRIARLQQERSTSHYFREGLALLHNMGPGRATSIIPIHLGENALIHHRYRKAKAYFIQALDAMQRIGDKRGEGIVCSGLARAAIGEGDYAAAETWCAESLRIVRRLLDRRNVAVILRLRAQIADASGDHAGAIDLLEKSLRIFRKLDTLHPVIDVPETLIDLSKLFLKMRNASRARQCLEEAVGMYETMDIPGRLADARNLLLTTSDDNVRRLASS